MTEQDTYINEEIIDTAGDVRKNEVQPKLYLCTTPIGNMGDITDRVRKVLERADAIYCEDTRNTSGLLSRLGIKNKTLVAAHMHNEEAAAQQIAEKVRSGCAVAYVSDAGMPCISDPGERIVRHFIENELPFEVLPGASAALTAAIYSGFSTRRVYFAGFLPRENAERAEFLAEIAKVSATVVIYESPHRVADTLAELVRLLGNRQAAVCRELTKLYEQTVRGDMASLAERYADNEPKGECVIVVSGENDADEGGRESMEEMLLRLMKGGMSAKDAAKQASLMLDVPRNEAYAKANEIKEKLR